MATGSNPHEFQVTNENICKYLHHLSKSQKELPTLTRALEKYSDHLSNKKLFGESEELISNEFDSFQEAIEAAQQSLDQLKKLKDIVKF